jgi:hypothetical protein
VEFFFARSLLFSFAALLLAGCATERRVLDTRKGTGSSNALDSRFAKLSKQERGEDGMMHASPDQRSEFEKLTFGADRGKEVKHQEYGTKGYKAQNWAMGDKSFAKKGFDGASKEAKGIRDQPYFVNKQFKSADAAFADSGRGYKTNDSSYTGEQWKGAGRSVETFSNKRVMNTPPVEGEIMDVHEYARKTIEDTNAMLGRKPSQ